MGSVIASHNRRIFQPTSNNPGSNCRNRADCPLDNKCLTANIVYKAVVSAPSKPDVSVLQKLHLKISSETTQEIFATKYVNSTELSKYMWKLNDEKITGSIKWNIMSIVHGTPKGGVCKLCLTEKFWLLKYFNDEHLLNKKSEFISKCRHENKLPGKSVEKG